MGRTRPRVPEFFPHLPPYLCPEASPQELEPVAIVIGLPQARLLAAEQVWGPARVEYASHVGRPVEHERFNWGAMCNPSTHCVVGIESANRIEGLMAVQRQLRSSQLEPTARVLYVDYLEVAPWNIETPVRGRHFAWVGSLLVRTALLLSVGTLASGNLGLHSLGQAEAFYRRHWFIELGSDPSYYNLNYFEFPSSRVETVLVNGWN